MQTFDEALRKLNGRDSRRLPEGNTWLERISENEIGVRYHSTYVVRYHRNGSITLHTGGWQTVTTKERINTYSPARIFQRDFVWYLSDGVEFTEGVDVGDVRPVAATSRPQTLFG